MNTSTNNKKIYIGNLPYSVTEQDIREKFETYGAVTEIALITDRETGRLKGFGFVTFETQAAAQGALAMNGQALKGRNIKVSMATDKVAGSGGSGGGARRSSGGGSRSEWGA